MTFTTILIALIVLVGLFLLLYFKKYTLLKKIALQLIDEAENAIIGDKAGDLRFTYVMDKIYSFVPWYLKFVIGESMLESIIQTVFDKARYISK